MKVGDKVRIARKVEKEEGWNNCWYFRMDETVGREGHIMHVDKKGILIEGLSYCYPKGALELIEDQSLVSMDKQYQTRNGRAVRVLCVDAKKEHYPVTALVTGSNGQEAVECYTETGGYLSDGITRDQDLIEVVPFQKDDKVMVRATGGKWIRRHFSHTNNGTHYVFSEGESSWTASAFTSWGEIRRPTAEELGEEPK